MSEPQTILIVDDDPDFVESNKDLLEAYGYRVMSAHDGASGLELAKQIHPDVMILDVMMATQTEGFEVARKIPQTPELQGLHVLLVTGVTKDLHLPFGFEPDESWLPVERVLEKPIAPTRLLSEIQKAMGKESPKGETHA
jgi:two-component system, OmpR family, alkaline phosphatase synthesis response regulator PhoP